MTNKNNKIENKITNNLITNGKKSKSEKILLNSIKELQKFSYKQTKKLIQSALILSSPIFKFHTIKNKKNKKKVIDKIIPTFISKQHKRISISIKFILTNKQKEKNVFYKKFKEEILTTYQNKSNTIVSKKIIQNQAILNKNLLKYYKWH